jgi:hypothetical protein
LTPGLTNGVYSIDGDLTLNDPLNDPLNGTGYTFTGGKNFVILVKGNVYINEKILVDKGSTLVISASKDITVNSSVRQIEGLYSADGKFTINTASNCPGTPDIKLNVAGTVIANAGRTGGTFVNNRTLCGGNSTNPSVSFIERPDFILNYPSLVRQTTRAWQDVAP